MPMYKCDSCTFEWSNDSGRMPRSCPSELCPNPKMWNALTEDKNKRNQITRIRRKQNEMSKVPEGDEVS